MEKFSVSRLIGAPPGYVGYEGTAPWFWNHLDIAHQLGVDLTPETSRFGSSHCFCSVLPSIKAYYLGVGAFLFVVTVRDM
jgi:hypothetical protein